MIMKKLAKILALAAAVIIVATGCKKLPTFTYTGGGGDTPSVVTPDVHTNKVTDITDKSALLHGSISNFSGFNEETLTVGFCWNATGEPTILQDNYFIFDFNPTNEGLFEYLSADFIAGKTYYVRALAYLNSNPDEVYYGEDMWFTTSSGGL